MTQPTTPDRTTLGEPVQALVLSTTANIVRVRVEPSASASTAIVGTFKAGDTITLRPTLTDAINGYQWYAIEQPLAGWCANVFKWKANTPADTPLVSLDVPYVPQVSGTANHYRNDCGCACALMSIRWRYQSVRLLNPTFTVDELSAKTSLPLHDDGLTGRQLVTLLEGYGVWAQVGKALDAAAIRRNLDLGMPVICLLNYADFNPTNAFKGGHFAIAKGYGATGVYFNDPYAGGANFYVTDTALNKALTDIGPFASTPNQGVTFVT